MFLIHVLGQSPNMEEYLSFCRANNLQLIEDVCESLGAHHNGIHAGNFGVLGTFSCYYSHHISTIEGGIITTNERNIYDELKSLRAHGWVRDRSDQSYWKEQYPQIDERFMFITSGYNVRPMELQGAIGSVQLKKLDGFLEGRENLAREVSEWLSSYVPWLHLIGSDRLPDKNAKEKGRRDRSHSWMMLPLRIDADAPVDVKQLKMHLESRGVETRALIAGNLARHPATKRFSIRSADSLAQCDELLAYGLMLGCHPVLDDKTKQTLKDAICSLGEL
jgi:CDP-4-dehydro-6-deoxyglucose reductase, E1